jgi:hypothetical protein
VFRRRNFAEQLEFTREGATEVTAINDDVGVAWVPLLASHQQQQRFSNRPDWSISFARLRTYSRPAPPLRPDLALGSPRGALNI